MVKYWFLGFLYYNPSNENKFFFMMSIAKVVLLVKSYSLSCDMISELECLREQDILQHFYDAAGLI